MIAAAPVRTIDIRKMTALEARFIGELLAEIWPRPGVTAKDRAERLLAVGRDYEGDDQHAPRTFAIFEMGRVVANATIVPRNVKIGESELMVAGLSRVCTDPRQRNRGLGALVVQAVFQRVDCGEFAAAFFQTNHTVRPFYEKLGCTMTENPIVNSLAEDPAANPFWDEIAMRYPASGPWGEGTVDLCGAGY